MQWVNLMPPMVQYNLPPAAPSAQVLRPTNFASATQVFIQHPLPTQTLVPLQPQLVGALTSPILPTQPSSTISRPDPVAYLISQANK